MVNTSQKNMQPAAFGCKTGVGTTPVYDNRVAKMNIMVLPIYSVMVKIEARDCGKNCGEMRDEGLKGNEF